MQCRRSFGWEAGAGSSVAEFISHERDSDIKKIKKVFLQTLLLHQQSSMQKWDDVLDAVNTHRYDLFNREPDLQIEYMKYTSAIRPLFLQGFGDIIKVYLACPSNFARSKFSAGAKKSKRNRA